LPARGGEGCFLKRRHKSFLAAAIAAIFVTAARAALAAPIPRGVTTARGEVSEPINVTGHETIYDAKEDTFTVIGDAVMTQGGSTLKADQIKLFRKQRTAIATGHVHLIDPDVEMWATEAKLDVVNETLELDNAEIRAKNTSYRLEGRKIRKLEGQKYEIVSGFFTSCGCSKKGAPDWSISADQMNVNIGKTATAKGASFNVLGYQPFKVPSVTFPADNSRHSGLLSGRIGQSGLRGFQWLQPYYFAIDKSQDATAAFDIETRQRVGGLAEYRLTNGPDDYLWVDGAFYDESLRTTSNRQGDIIDNQTNDPFIPLNRYGIIGMTRQHLTDHLIAYGDAISVSDDYYLREMDVWTLSSGFGSNWGSLRDAISHWGLLDEFDHGYAQLQGTWHQDLIQANQFALQELPKLLLSGRRDIANGLAFLDYDAQAVNFYRASGQDGLRFAVTPRFTIPWRLGDYLYGFGSVGVQGNVYDTSGRTIAVTPVGQPCTALAPKPDGSAGVANYNNCLTLGPLAEGGFQGIGVPYLTTGVATELERVWDVNGAVIEKLKNTIEPFASYAYVPRIYQGDLPLFDQYDRLNSRSLFTYGVTTRLFAKLAPQPSEPEPEIAPETATGPPAVGASAEQSSPSEAFGPGGASSYSHGQEVRELARVTLMQAYDLSHDLGPFGNHLSDFQANLTVFPTTIASLGSQVDYNPRNHAGVTFANVYFTFQPPWSRVSNIYMGKALQGSFLQASYNYVNPTVAVLPTTTANASQFAQVRAYSDIFDVLGVYIAPSYNFSTNQLQNAQYGARLKSPCDCWAADFGLIDSFNPNEVQVQFQLTLGGLGSIGQSPFGRNPFQTNGLAGNPLGVLPPH
jgi:lipopolysaccharide assembly outer membrane protein LptD (OstA)